MNRKHFIYGLFIGASVCYVATVNAQTAKEYPKPDPMTASMTEVWVPQPKVVTPGTVAEKMIAPPSDATVLFNGKDLSAWEDLKGNPPQWTVENGVFTMKRGAGDIRTKQKFESFQLHIEWRAPATVVSSGQGRGNSGVFLQGIYEVQVLDSYENETYANGMAGSLYKHTPPLVNAMQKPGNWNTYDIIYSAPVFNGDGTYRFPPTVTVLHNGVLIQNHTVIRGTTPYLGLPEVNKHGAGPILLQDHDSPVSFRNVWIRELK